MIEDELIKEFKKVIEESDVIALKELHLDYMDTEFPREIDWPYIYQKVYLHACLKKKKDMAAWVESLFDQVDPIQKIAYRQTFAYGRTLLNKMR